MEVPQECSTDSDTPTLDQHTKKESDTHDMQLLQQPVTKMVFDKDDCYLSGCMAISPSGNEIAFSTCDTIRIHDIQSGLEVSTINIGRRFRPNVLVYSSDGAYIINGDYNGVLSIWRVNDGSCINTISVYSDCNFKNIYTVAVSSNGKYIAFGGSGKIVYLLCAKSFRILREFGPYPYSINSVAFSPDGQSLAVCIVNSFVDVWDITSMDIALPFMRYSNAVTTVVFCPDGMHLLAAGEYQFATVEIRRSVPIHRPKSDRIGREVVLGGNSIIYKSDQFMERQFKYPISRDNVFKSEYETMGISADGVLVAASFNRRLLVINTEKHCYCKLEPPITHAGRIMSAVFNLNINKEYFVFSCGWDNVIYISRVLF